MLFVNEETGSRLWVQEYECSWAWEAVYNPMEDLVNWPDEVQVWVFDRDWHPNGAENMPCEQAVAEELYPEQDWWDVDLTWNDYLDWVKQETGWEDVSFVFLYEHSVQHFYTGRIDGVHDRWDSRPVGIIAMSPESVGTEKFIESYDDYVNLPIWEIIDLDDITGKRWYGQGWTEEAALEYLCETGYTCHGSELPDGVEDVDLI